MIKNNKAEMSTSQIFTYILALVVTSLILLYGYNAITKMKSQTDTVSLLQFKNDLTNAIDSLSYDYGSVEIKRLAAPPGFNELCFVNLEASPAPSFDPKYNLIKNSFDSGSKNNVFLLGVSAFEPFQVTKISPDSNFVCIPSVGGKIPVRLEAVGGAVKVSNANP